MATWVTPSLVIDEEQAEGEDTFSLDGVDTAVNWILKGNSVGVSSEKVAVEVLLCLGLSRREVDDRLHFAKTGEVLVS